MLDVEVAAIFWLLLVRVWLWVVVWFVEDSKMIDLERCGLAGEIHRI